MDKNLIRAEELVVKLNEYFSTQFSVNTIKQLRQDGKIPAVDTRTPGTKVARWKYNFEEVKKSLEDLKNAI